MTYAFDLLIIFLCSVVVYHSSLVALSFLPVSHPNVCIRELAFIGYLSLHKPISYGYVRILNRYKCILTQKHAAIFLQPTMTSSPTMALLFRSNKSPCSLLDILNATTSWTIMAIFHL